MVVRSKHDVQADLNEEESNKSVKSSKNKSNLVTAKEFNVSPESSSLFSKKAIENHIRV